MIMKTGEIILKKRLLTYFIFFHMATFCVVAQKDNPPPESPDLKRVTVELATGNASLHWTKSPSPDVIAYIIHIEKIIIQPPSPADTIWIPVDTINNPNATYYLNTNSNATIFSESYVISALAPPAPDFKESANTEKHSTIFTTLQFDPCQAELNLSWTHYIGWADSLEYYNIFRNKEGGSFSIIDSLPPESNSFTDTTIEAYVNYCYYIQAKHKNGLTSTSNKVCKYTQMPRIPGFINADYATINSENDEVYLSFTIDPASEIYHYKLLRTDDQNGMYDTIFDFADHRSEKLTYTDKQEDLLSPFYYKLAAINQCNRIIVMSNIASTMVLTVINEDAINYLAWTPNIGWEGGVKNYEVYRKTMILPSELIATVTFDVTSYVDKLNNLIYNVDDAKFCYYINAVEGENNPHGIKGSSTTAINCVVLQPKIFIPNAFTPNGDGKNDAWFPKLSFTPATYHLIIKNRWGNIIFESKDQYESWDGSYMGGAKVEEGTYIYFLRVTTGTGETIVRNGVINIIFP